MSKFQMTDKGYKSAERWLKKIGEWERLSTDEKGFLINGCCIVSKANVLWERREG